MERYDKFHLGRHELRVKFLTVLRLVKMRVGFLTTVVDFLRQILRVDFHAVPVMVVPQYQRKPYSGIS